MSDALNLVVVDTETGGLSPSTSCIIEIAAKLVRVSGSRVKEATDALSFYSRMPPDRAVSDHAARVNGYVKGEWEEHEQCEPRIDGLTRLTRWCDKYAPEGSMWCGSNVTFDLSFLESDLSRLQLEMPSHFSYRKVDIESLCFPLFATGRTKGIGLKHLRKWAGLGGEQRHRAIDDVNDVIAVLRKYMLTGVIGVKFQEVLIEVSREMG